MHKGFLWQAIFWMSLPILAILTILLVRRKLVSKFPFFFSYIAAGLVIDLLRRFTLRSRPPTYFYVYWFSDIVSTLLAFLATMELILVRLFPGFYKFRFYRYLFSFAAIVIACLTAITASQSKTPLMLPIVIRTLHTFDFLRVAMLIFLVGLMAFMGRRWEQYEFAIALGLGMNAAAFLIAFSVRTRYLATFTDNLPAFAYDAACLIWLVSFMRSPQSVPVSTDPKGPEIIQKARKWEEALKDSVSGKKDL